PLLRREGAEFPRMQPDLPLGRYRIVRRLACIISIICYTYLNSSNAKAGVVNLEDAANQVFTQYWNSHGYQIKWSTLRRLWITGSDVVFTGFSRAAGVPDKIREDVDYSVNCSTDIPMERPFRTTVVTQVGSEVTLTDSVQTTSEARANISLPLADL